MKLSPELLKLLKNGDAEQRLDVLQKMSISPEIAREHLAELIFLLDDSWSNGMRGSAFGPTGINPDKDLPIALKAKDILCSLGEAVIAPLLKEFNTYASEPRHFYALQILGDLRAKEAIPIFEKLILEWRNLSVRVNFDQEDNFEISLAAYKAYLNTDKDACKKFISSILDNSYFEAHPEKLYYKKSLLYYLKTWHIVSE